MNDEVFWTAASWQPSASSTTGPMDDNTTKSPAHSSGYQCQNIECHKEKYIHFGNETGCTVHAINALLNVKTPTVKLSSVVISGLLAVKAKMVYL